MLLSRYDPETRRVAFQARQALAADIGDLAWDFGQLATLLALAAGYAASGEAFDGLHQIADECDTLSFRLLRIAGRASWGEYE